MNKKLFVLIGCVIAIAIISKEYFAQELQYDSPRWNAAQQKFIRITPGETKSWLMMRIREGQFPDVDKAEANSLLMPANIELIHSPAEVPRATWIGHASVLVQFQGVNFLTDPHLTARPSPVDHFVHARYTPPALSFEQLPKIDFIVISHNHYDHLDHRTVAMFGSSVVWYVPLGLKRWFINQGIEPDKVIELDWWQTHLYKQQVEVTFTPTVHWSKRKPWDTNQSLWGSWNVKINDFNSWFAGDTGYDDKIFKEIGRRMGVHQLAFIPIGAYAPRYFMGKYHVDPAQAVLIHQDIKSEKSMPIHWATFQLTQEPFLEPQKLLNQEVKLANLSDTEFKIVKIGETITPNTKIMSRLSVHTENKK